MPASSRMDAIVNLAKRRGFLFPAAEVYGGLGGFWDFGPLGVLLKNNIKRAWWKRFVQLRDDMVGLDSAIITNPAVWKASGHVDTFTDTLVECKVCHLRFKADDEKLLEDHIIEEIVKKFKQEKDFTRIVNKAREALESEGIYSSYSMRKSMMEFQRVINNAADEKLLNNIAAFAKDPVEVKKIITEPRKFNTMFKTYVGPAEETSSTAYLRPETAQSIFVDFDSVRQTMRRKLPFGIAQIGKAFRNEITPGNFIFRSREFEQMEIEFFVDSDSADEWFEKWVKESHEFFLGLGIKPEHLRLVPASKADLAHYSKATTDIEYEFGFEKGWAELTGIANRGDYDLSQHGQAAKGDKSAFAVDGKVPFVIEPSFGVDRAVLAFLLDAYDEVEGGRSTTTEANKEKETVLRLHPALAPYKAAVLPLSKKPELAKVAQEVLSTLRQHWMVDYDETASIGRRYRRQDEIGTPYCITVDFDSLEDKQVTVRDRDTMQQERIPIATLHTYLWQKLGNL